jgi:hypothetical protein
MLAIGAIPAGPLCQALALAQAGSATTQASSRVLLLVGILIGLAVVGGVVVLAFRRNLLKSDSDAGRSVGLAETLRRMRDSGAMSQEEYDRVRKSMARKAGGARPGSMPPQTGTPRARPERPGPGQSG